MVYAHAASERRDAAKTRMWIWLTILLGGFFMGFKSYEYATEIHHGFTLFTSNFLEFLLHCDGPPWVPRPLWYGYFGYYRGRRYKERPQLAPGGKHRALLALCRYRLDFPFPADVHR